MDIPQEEILKKYQELPKDVQDALNSEIGIKKIGEISKAFDLHLDEQEELANETTLLLLGLINLEEFLKNIENKLNVNSEKATKISESIHKEIFLPIKNQIKETYVNTEVNNIPPQPTPFEKVNIIKMESKVPIKIQEPDKEYVKKEINPLVQSKPTLNENVGLEIVGDNNKLIDKNLQNKYSTFQESIRVKVEEKPKLSPDIQPKLSKDSRGYILDPYREPVE